MKSILIKIYDDLDAKVEKTALEIKRMEEIKPHIQAILDARRDEACEEFFHCKKCEVQPA